jgi:adenylyltransferase/sulfurtransferase
MSGWLLLYDALATSFHKVRIKPDPDCQLCGAQPTIEDLAVHLDGDAESCG